MADVPSNLKFLESHEWARAEEDGTVTVGISDLSLIHISEPTRPY